MYLLCIINSSGSMVKRSDVRIEVGLAPNLLIQCKLYKGTYIVNNTLYNIHNVIS
jgi:hypothetical protein